MHHVSVSVFLTCFLILLRTFGSSAFEVKISNNVFPETEVLEFVFTSFQKIVFAVTETGLSLLYDVVPCHSDHKRKREREREREP